MSDKETEPAEATAVDVDASGDDETTIPEHPTRYGLPFSDGTGQLVLHCPIDRYLGTVGALRDDGFVSVVDLCGVDYLTNATRALPHGIKSERFEVVVNLISHAPPRRVRLRVQVPGADPIVPTLFDLFPGTENMEREAFDMFGIVFTDHPDPTRILMPIDWQGHPLRKDFAVGSVPVQFKDAPAAR